MIAAYVPAEDETTALTAAEGDLLVIVSEDDEWIDALEPSSGRNGYVPRSYVEPVRPGAPCARAGGRDVEDERTDEGTTQRR